MKPNFALLYLNLLLPLVKVLCAIHVYSNRRNCRGCKMLSKGTLNYTLKKEQRNLKLDTV